MAEITNDKKTIASIMDQAQVCRLGLVDNGTPYVVPVSYGFDGDTLYFHSGLKSRKLEILRQNPKTCVQVDHKAELAVQDAPCRCSFNYYSVIGQGTAEFLEGFEEKVKGLHVITRHYLGKEYEYQEPAVDKIAVLKVKFDTITAKISGYR
jgi:nitroimidazol reductase NimA-like FMN-containing flavoprotein (pyridoxamine 5'-phosphate oxidase superfamily)